MAITNNRLSVCCFKPVTQNEDFEPVSDDVKFYCSHCGKLADKTILWTSGAAGNVIELVIRRYKDGDTNYQDVLATLNQVLADNSNSKLNAILAAVGDGKPDKWTFNWMTRRWDKADDPVSDLVVKSVNANTDVANPPSDPKRKANT